MNIAQILALPRAEAFAQGLLIPIAPWRRRGAGIPLPVRLTVPAWTTLVAYPGPRGRAPDPRDCDVRLGRLLEDLADAISNIGAVALSDRAMFVGLCRSRPPRGLPGGSVVVFATPDEEGQETLTLALVEEGFWDWRGAWDEIVPPYSRNTTSPPPPR